jgi:hypothetical protein
LEFIWGGRKIGMRRVPYATSGMPFLYCSSGAISHVVWALYYHIHVGSAIETPGVLSFINNMAFIGIACLSIRRQNLPKQDIKLQSPESFGHDGDTEDRFAVSTYHCVTLSDDHMVKNSLMIRMSALFFLPFAPLLMTQMASAESYWTKGAAMPTARSEITSAVLNGKICDVGGFVNSHSTNSIVEVYDPVTDKWAKVAPLPQPLDHTKAASFDGKLYVIGLSFFTWNCGFDGIRFLCKRFMSRSPTIPQARLPSALYI